MAFFMREFKNFFSAIWPGREAIPAGPIGRPAMECDALSTDFIIDFRTLIYFAPFRVQVVLYRHSPVRSDRIWLGNFFGPMAGYFLETITAYGNRFADAVEPVLVAKDSV